MKDLKPGTEYNIGVLIIMDDGNINKEEDIVYGLYNTTCRESKYLYYFGNLYILCIEKNRENKEDIITRNNYSNENKIEVILTNYLLHFFLP